MCSRYPVIELSRNVILGNDRRKQKWIPINDRTLGITLERLQAFFDKIEVKPVWVDL